MKFDPRTRLVMMLLAVIALAATRSVWILAAALGCLLAIGLLTGRAKTMRQTIRLVGPMCVLVFILSVHGAGPEAATAAVLRLTAIVAASAVTLGGTSPVELGNALVAGGLPYPAAFVLMASMQFVPVISRKASGVRDAQRARGIPLDAGIRGLRHTPALVLPVLFHSFTLADELAEALECRGFAREGRTFRRAYRLGGPERLLLCGAALGVAVYVRAGGL